MTKMMFGIFAAVVAAMATGAAIFFAPVNAQTIDEIEYGKVYECGKGRSRFKVLSCKGSVCEVFYINELSPGGGFKDTVNRSLLEGSIRQGCTAKGSTENRIVGPAPKSTPGPAAGALSAADVSCFASDTEVGIQNVNEKSFRTVLRNFWQKAPIESGPTVTLTFQKMTVGAPRKWRPTFDDAYSQADPRKPIFPVRATFTTCTDYTDAITTRKMERIYDCYVHKTGGWQCSQTGASGPLALKDEKKYLPKKR